MNAAYIFVKISAWKIIGPTIDKFLKNNFGTDFFYANIMMILPELTKKFPAVIFSMEP